jgi:hypothetical protein
MKVRRKRHCLSVLNSAAKTCTTSTLGWSGTSKARGSSSFRHKNGDQTLNSRPGAHPTTSTPSEEVISIRNSQEPVLEVSTHPALHACIVSYRNAHLGIKALSCEHGTQLVLEADVQDRKKGASESEYQKGAGNIRNTVEVGYCSICDESQCPVDRSESPAHVFAPHVTGLGEFGDFLEETAFMPMFMCSTSRPG